jgi:O-antigen ligase
LLDRGRTGLLVQMYMAIHPPRARRRRLAIAAISAMIALVAAVLAYGAVKPVVAVSTHVFVDTAPPSVVHRPPVPVTGLIQRAELLGRIMTSAEMTDRIARRAGVPPQRLGVEAHITANVPSALLEPASEERASDILMADRPYRIEVEGRPSSPILDIYTHAPTIAAAKRLADAGIVELRARLQTLAADAGVPAHRGLALRQLGTTRASVVNAGLALAIAVTTFLVVLALAAAALRCLSREPGRPAARPVRLSEGDDPWPHTVRLMPWAFALCLVMVWLLPFEVIVLKVGTPIDISLDRIVLPVAVAMWLLALAVGGSAAPRIRITRIHVTVGAFVAAAFLSVIVNARSLNQTLELELALKQLPLLISYVFVFVIASTAIRAEEIRAFLSLTLGLALVCAVGVLWEYRFKQNLFYEWSDKLLPPIFEVPKLDSAHVDAVGRRSVQGPGVVPLETVGMLAMALPIPLVRLMQSKSQREALLYGLAACLLFAAAFATFRKSALLAPLSVVGTIAYFRRRELLKLAPFLLVVIAVIPVLAPGAAAMITEQFEPDRLGVATVSDRASDYDGVRPDLWSHMLAGRGWGTYTHGTYRLLDSEILHRLVETGVIGLIAYLLMIASVVSAARATIASRDPRWAPIALMGAAAAVSFAVVSTLFDVLSFLHAVFLFLLMAGLTATVVTRHQDEAELGTGDDAGPAAASPPRWESPHVGVGRPVREPVGVAAQNGVAAHHHAEA